GSVESVAHDLRRREGLADIVRGVDAVIHCAALLNGSEHDQQAVTVDGTKNLLDAMAAAGVAHIVLISTFALYDYRRIPAGSALTEESPLDETPGDRAPYVRVKKAQEEFVREYGRLHGWRVTILRPGLVFGPGRTWFHHLGIAPSPRLWIGLAGRSALPLTHVENCADAIVLAAETPAAAGATLNVVDDNPPERRDYLRTLAQHAAPRPLIGYIPWGLIHLCASVASGTNRVLLRGKAPLPDLLRPASLDPRCKPLSYPNDRAKQVLGWSPRLAWQDALTRSV